MGTVTEAIGGRTSPQDTCRMNVTKITGEKMTIEIKPYSGTLNGLFDPQPVDNGSPALEEEVAGTEPRSDQGEKERSRTRGRPQVPPNAEVSEEEILRTLKRMKLEDRQLLMTLPMYLRLMTYVPAMITCLMYLKPCTLTCIYIN